MPTFAITDAGGSRCPFAAIASGTEQRRLSSGELPFPIFQPVMPVLEKRHSAP
jgi:hypothetical protein